MKCCINCQHCNRPHRFHGSKRYPFYTLPCPFCGEPLMKRNHPHPTAGKRFGKCVVCGRRRLHGAPCWYHDVTAIAAAMARAYEEGGAA